MKVKLVEKLNLPRYLIEADIYESDYHKLLTQELQDKIVSNPELKEKVKKGIIDSEIAKLVEDEKDIKAILTNRDLDTDQVFPELMEKYLRLLHLPLGKDETALVIAELSREDPDRIFDNDAPLLEFIKNIANKVADLDYDVLRLIKELNKSGDITNLDLRNPSSWIASDNIWKKERKAADQMYKIKLKVFLSDSSNVKKFKTTAGKALPQNLADWNIASGETATNLKALYAKYNSDAYDKEEAEKQKHTLNLSDFIKENKWEISKVRDNLIKLIAETNLLDKNNEKDEKQRQDLILILKEVFSNKSDMINFMRNVRIPKDVSGTPDKLKPDDKNTKAIVSAVIKYLISEQSNIEKSVVDEFIIKPNSKISFKQYLTGKKLTEEQGYKEFINYLNTIEPQSVRKLYLDTFNRVWKDKDGLRKDLLSAMIDIDAKSNIQLANSLKNYIDSISKPDTKMSFRDYLTKNNLTEEEGFRDICKYLTRLQPKDIRANYVKAFKRIWEDKTGLRKDFLSATLIVDSKGNIQWAKSLKKYIDNIQNPQ